MFKLKYFIEEKPKHEFCPQGRIFISASWPHLMRKLQEKRQNKVNKGNIYEAQQTSCYMLLIAFLEINVLATYQ